MMNSTTTFSPSLKKVTIAMVIFSMIYCIQPATASSSSLRNLKKGSDDIISSTSTSIDVDPRSEPLSGLPARRETLYARATLLNLDLKDLSPQQAIFFETAFIDVFNELQIAKEGTKTSIGQKLKTKKKEKNQDDEGVRIRSLIVEDALKGNKPSGKRDGNDRRLRGRFLDEYDVIDGESRRSLSFYKYYRGGYFDILAFFEISCRLCPADNDDDDDDYYDRRFLLETEEAAEDGITAAASHLLFEKTLLNRLRSGPFSEFHDLEECNIVYFRKSA